MGEKRELSPEEKRVKRKQYVWLGVAAAVTLAITAITVAFTGPVQKPAQRAETKQIALGGGASDRDAWRASESARIEGTEKTLKELKDQVQTLQSQLRRKSGEDSAREVLAERAPPGGLPPAPNGPVAQVPQKQSAFPPNPNQPFRTIGASGSPLPVVPAQKPGGPGEQVAPAGSSLKVLAIAMPAGGERSGKPGVRKTSGEKESAGSGAEGSAADASAADGAGPADVYVPAGSFARAALLTGVDAPTGGGNQQQNPMPVLMRLQDDVQLPNEFRAPLKGCFVLGNAVGDLSTERALIRLDRLSCVDESGNAIDKKVAGWATDETGRDGVRGEVVYKAGKVIANAITSGLLSGIGEGVRADSVQQNTTITGAVTEQVTNPWRAGIGKGVAKSFDRISEFYLKQADRIFPVISIDPGRSLEVVFLKGVDRSPRQ